MSTRNIKDAKDLTTGKLIYFKGHAQATFMSDGRTVEEAVSEMSAVDTSNLATKDELAQKQDIISDIDTIRNNAANYKGTVTGVKINGTTKNPSNGVVDIGTVLTAHQDISGKVDKTLNAKAFESIDIRTSNTTEAINANKAAIQAYANNLNMLGVDTKKGFNVPIKIIDNHDFYGCLTGRYITGAEGYFLIGSIFCAGAENYVKDIYIGPSGYYSELVNIKNDNILGTSSKDLIGAINEVNTLAKKKQDTLTSGTNIKTINNQSLLGSGNIKISAPSITVDTTMSNTSTNPVQNKVIKAYIDGLVGNVAARLAQI